MMQGSENPGSPQAAARPMPLSDAECERRSCSPAAARVGPRLEESKQKQWGRELKYRLQIGNSGTQRVDAS
ncbi:hypothetical protein NDU88_005492 [Pleurodeles waltl]|uniref:Uncharacterized protein n=1 Tax=Pleurodeles waltl TaxID=8319 RepID=A0AAV7L372_PLEWA|nr:hypothetical protein NDU88_005492 [Pleurodeles waltl]